MAEIRLPKAVTNYSTASRKVVIPMEMVIEDFQQFLAFNTPPQPSCERMPNIMPISTGILSTVSIPEWGEITDIKGNRRFSKDYKKRAKNDFDILQTRKFIHLNGLPFRL